jgi:hypothetical protein
MYQEEIKKQYQQLENYLSSISSQHWSEEYQKGKKNKEECPFCNSKNITQDIKRVKGEIDADMSSSHYLFGGNSSMSVHGEIDTHEVLVCQDCKNVWKPYETDYKSASECFYSLLHNFYFWADGMKDLDDIDFELDNPREKYNSREEKIAAEEKRLNDSYLSDECILRQFYPDVIRWYIKNSYSEYNFYRDIEDWDDEWFEKFGFKMPPKEERPIQAPSSSLILIFPLIIVIIVLLVWIL